MARHWGPAQNISTTLFFSSFELLPYPLDRKICGTPRANTHKHPTSNIVIHRLVPRLLALFLQILFLFCREIATVFFVFPLSEQTRGGADV